MTDTTAIARGTSPIGENLADAWDHNGHNPASGPPITELETAVDAAQFAAAALTAHARNPLIANLDANGNLGARLTPDQVTAVIGIVAMLEGAPQQPQLMP